MQLLFRSLAGICCLLALWIGCNKPTDSPAERTPVLLISFDGFRYDYLSRTATPYFDSIAATGVSAEALIPVFPTKTFPNHYSIATGLYPEKSGLVGNTMYDPVFDEWYRISDRDAVEDGKWYGGEPIWNTVGKQGLKAGTLFWVGSEADIQGMHPTYWKPYDGDMPMKARIDTVVKWLAYDDERAVNFATLYFEHVDYAGHRFGPDSDSVTAAIRQSDRLIGYLKTRMREQGLWDSTNIIILSDHGMAGLSAGNIILLDHLIPVEDLDYIIPGPPVYIQPKDGKTEEIYRQLKEHKRHYRVYKKEDIPERYHLKNNRRVTDILMVADPGYAVIREDQRAGFLESLPAGTHGYDHKTPAMHALFMARGPAFKQEAKVPAFQNIHIYELISHLLNIRPAPNDGSLDSVRVLLK